MINPLKVATSGYLKRTTKAVLIISVAGYLNFGGTPPTPPTPPNPIPQNTGSFGAGEIEETLPKKSIKVNREQKILREDDEILSLIIGIWKKLN